MFIDFQERGSVVGWGERETDRLGIEPATFGVWDDAPTN